MSERLPCGQLAVNGHVRRWYGLKLAVGGRGLGGCGMRMNRQCRAKRDKLQLLFAKITPLPVSPFRFVAEYLTDFALRVPRHSESAASGDNSSGSDSLIVLGNLKVC